MPGVRWQAVSLALVDVFLWLFTLAPSFPLSLPPASANENETVPPGIFVCIFFCCLVLVDKYPRVVGFIQPCGGLSEFFLGFVLRFRVRSGTGPDGTSAHP